MHSRTAVLSIQPVSRVQVLVHYCQLSVLMGGGLTPTHCLDSPSALRRRIFARYFEFTA